MSADWDEVKRLAADFQRAQLSSTIQKLSERNCIEIVKKLIELKLIEVIFTTDGKEYLTPSRLLKEIKDELIVHGGRINLVDLAQIIGVDYSHVETKANEFLNSESNTWMVLGQLITSDYLDHLAEEVNEKLHQVGEITIAEITKLYDLPGDFLTEVIHNRLGTIVHGQADTNDSRTFFTDSYVSQHTARIRGALSAITRPMPLSSIINHFKFPEKLFYCVVEDLIKEGRLAGSISGGRSERAIYVPDIYAKSQNEYIDSFFKQNGYLEYDAVASRRKQHADYQNNFTTLLSHILMFEKATELFSEDVCAQLLKHLLKTLCSDLVNMIVNYLAQEHGVAAVQSETSFTIEQRLKIINKFSEDIRQPLIKLHNSLNAKNLEDFHPAVETVLGAGICDMIVRKPDKKKERLVLANHRQSLLTQLSEASEPALCLHVAVLLIFQTHTHNMLHASGKFVPHIIVYLQRQVPFEVYELLATYQELVIKKLTPSDDEEEKKTIETTLVEKMSKIKEVAVTYKKSSISETDPSVH
uniref:E3 UFM1-protein ligase 1 homolog n=1 Tax=Parasteatoda tepidariorum TaxID=114398 RepID=A0A2L2Y2N6_PARTP